MKHELAHLARARRHNFVAWYPEGQFHVNLRGDYDYLEGGYYSSLDLETANSPIRPTCKESLDAYVPPLLLEKARLHGISVPEFYISNGYFEPPVVIDPINPFGIRSRVVLKTGRENSVAKSLTRNFTYAICCQDIPAGAQIRRFRSVMGWSVSVRFREMSLRIWEVFGIPLAVVRAMILPDGKQLLSDLSPLPYERLGSRELSFIEGRVKWPE